MRVTKEVTFDAAHMLSKYNGPCCNLHGHTYKLQVSFEREDGEIVRTEGHQYRGMVMDFRELNTTINSVIKIYDHAIIFGGEDARSATEEALLDWAIKYSMNFVVMESGRSTCENILWDILNRMEQALRQQQGLYGNKHAIISGKLWETPTSFCEEHKFIW